MLNRIWLRKIAKLLTDLIRFNLITKIVENLPLNRVLAVQGSNYNKVRLAVCQKEVR